jgi:small subunit ribosomal protein S1
MTENFKDLFEKSLKQTEMRIGKIIKATVVKVDREFVWLDSVLKSESCVPLEQFKNKDGNIDVKIGNQVEVVLESLDNNFGETQLSREKAKKIELWNALEIVHKNKETILGKIINHVRGGYTVEVQGLRAFLPGSLVDVRPLKDITHLEGKDIEFKIVKLDTKRSNIVLSRRAIIEAETKQDRDLLFERLQEGATIKGTVKNITDFGAFIDLGGIDGLLHITDISWSRIKHPSELLKLGAEINVKIIKFDKEKNRVSLGIKQMEEDPWINIAKDISIGTKILGKVTNITDYGCFVKIKEGIEGLVHSSEMDWSHKTSNPHKIMTIGQDVEVMILEVDASRHRISLGIKQCCINPWKAFNEQYKKGDEVIGTVRSITDFGIFIGLQGNIDGLIHISDISWNDPKDVIKEFKKGEQIKTIMLSIDVERERIALGIKQLQQDPFENFYNTHDVSKRIKGRIIDIQENGMTVELLPGVLGFLKKNELSNSNNEKINECKLNQIVEVYAINIDIKRRKINLSIHSSELNNNPSNTKKVSKVRNDYQSIIPTTIGELIKKELNK